MVDKDVCMDYTGYASYAAIVRGILCAGNLI